MQPFIVYMRMSPETGSVLCLDHGLRSAGARLFRFTIRNAKFGVLLAFLIPLAVAAQQTLKVDVNLVNIFLTVQNDRGEFVTGLERNDFAVYDDDEPQEISVFEKQDAVRSSTAILMDTSGSMVDILPFMRRGVRDFTRPLARSGDLSVITFGTGVRMIYSTPDSQQHLERVMETLKPYGTSVLFDAMMFGLQKVNKTDNERKALIVFTDGNDNGSNVSYNSVIQEAQLSGTLLYFIAIGSPVLVDIHTLDSLANTSGGRVFYVPKGNSVSDVLDKIRVEMSRQYYIGYYTARRPGYHRLRVELPGKDLKIHARAGYLGG